VRVKTNFLTRYFRDLLKEGDTSNPRY